MEVNMSFHQAKVMRIHKTFFVIKNQDLHDLYFFIFNLFNLSEQLASFYVKARNISFWNLKFDGEVIIGTKLRTKIEIITSVG